MTITATSMLFDLLYRSLAPKRKAAQGEELTTIGTPSRQQWLAVSDLALSNEVSGLVYDAILTLPPHQKPDSDILMRWTAHTQGTERDNLLFRREMCTVLDHFAQCGLEPIILKGLTLSELYPNPLHRPVGDIDLYVTLDHQHRFVQALEQLGATTQQGYDAKHISMQCRGMQWELHFRSIYFYNMYHDRRYQLLEREETASDCLFHADIEGHSVLVFPPRLQMVYLTAHFMHHLLVEQVTFRQVVDWMLALHHDRTALAIGEVLFVRTLRELGMYRLYRAMGYIVVHHLGFQTDGYAGLTGLTKGDARRGRLLLQVLILGHVPGCKPYTAQSPTDTLWQRVRHFARLCHSCYVLMPLCPREALSTPFGFLRHAWLRRRAERQSTK